MRLGIYGGTFDPVHYGHLLLAEQCREQCELDEVRFVPASVPPHKQGEGITASRHRVNMLDFAVAGFPELTISEVELQRTGPSYTVDTLQQFAEQDASCALFLLMGMDSLVELPSWREPCRILELATVVAVNRRSGHPDGAAERAIELCQSFCDNAAERIRIVEMPDVDISATDIRRRACAGRSIRFLTPRPVALYISEHGLYCEARGEREM